MRKLSGHYHKLTPIFVKRWIDPDAFRIRDFVASAISETPAGSRILDAGAGESRNRAMITHQTYIAVDAACGDPAWNYGDLDVIADLEQTPFGTDSFDLVICTQVLEHVREPQQVLKELLRVNKSGGALCLSAPQGWGVHQPPFDFFRYTHFGLKYLLENAGYEVISIVPSCGYFGYLANRLTVFPKTLFWQIKKRWLRLVLFPAELVAYMIFVFLLPSLLNLFDFLDRERNYTLNYLVLAKKPPSSDEL